MMKHKLFANTVLVISVVLLVLALYFSFNKQDHQEMFLFGYKPFIITSGSMEPKYPVNSMVVVKQVEASEIQVGDAIAFYSVAVNSNVFHRVVKITDEGFLTQGDNNQHVDSDTVHPQDLVGKEVFYTTLTVPILAHFQSPFKAVIFGFISLSSLYIAVHFFIRYRKEKRGVIQ